MIPPSILDGPRIWKAVMPREVACYDLLDRLAIPYTRVDHDPADTIEACHASKPSWAPPSARTWCCATASGRPSTCCSWRGTSPSATKDLSQQIGSARLSFAPAEDMEKYLGVAPGSATLLPPWPSTGNTRCSC